MSLERGIHSVARDPSLWQANIACRAACPAGTDARALVVAIARGDYLEAYRIARATNPFASICGRICPAPCEAACIRGNLDAPVTIRALERLVCEQYGPESANGARLSAAFARVSRSDRIGVRVAVAGAGPAGLTAAHDLALAGYAVTVFEASERPGGALLEVPEHQLAPRVRDAEIAAVFSLGVDLQAGVSVGRDVGAADLLAAGYAAVLAPTGELQNDPSGQVAHYQPAASVVEAVVSGQRGAAAVIALLTGERTETLTSWALTPIPPDLYECLPSRAPRVDPPIIGDAVSGPIELSFSDAEAREQAGRCVRCDVSPVVDEATCTLCSVCEDACPEKAISRSAQQGAGPALLIDYSACTRCGVCARACPEHAITMSAFEDETVSVPSGVAAGLANVPPAIAPGRDKP